MSLRMHSVRSIRVLERCGCDAGGFLREHRGEDKFLTEAATCAASHSSQCEEFMATKHRALPGPAIVERTQTPAYGLPMLGESPWTICWVQSCAFEGGDEHGPRCTWLSSFLLSDCKHILQGSTDSHRQPPSKFSLLSLSRLQVVTHLLVAFGLIVW